MADSSKMKKSNDRSSETSPKTSPTTSRNIKRKCKVLNIMNDIVGNFENCDFKDVVAIENQLQKVAKANAFTDDEMRLLIQKFVKNEHVLALVTLKAEDEIARENCQLEDSALIITDTPSVPKLTRSKARELNKIPTNIISDATKPEIAALIEAELHSDDDDEEYSFKEEDFMSDDDPNTTASDLDSNPHTPQTYFTENTPTKLTDDGCFKIPPIASNSTNEDLRIAARTRSKLSLQETTIEDIQSEFVPPDLEHFDIPETDTFANDEEWMQFLNDFSKPLNSNTVVDDDDPVNDPEYVAAEKIPVDAEELRDVNISKKELTDLLAELLEGVDSFETFDFDVPPLDGQQTVVLPTTQELLKKSDLIVQQTEVDPNVKNTNEHQIPTVEANKFDNIVQQDELSVNADENVQMQNESQIPTVETTYIPANINVVSSILENSAIVNNNESIFVPVSNAAIEPRLIAIPIPGQPNQYEIARIVDSQNVNTDEFSRYDFNRDDTSTEEFQNEYFINTNDIGNRYSQPYDTNFTHRYISIKKHIYSEYAERFESLRSQENNVITNKFPDDAVGFTPEQYQLLQQQLRIHVQMLTQTFVQTYCHPEFWKLAKKPKQMLHEIQEKSKSNASFKAWNLELAIDLMKNWEAELSVDNIENTELMKFINTEIIFTSRNARQIPRFAPRIMDLILNSNVFMYPQYLPRIPFTPGVCYYQSFCPAESQLIAMGLEKYMTSIGTFDKSISFKEMGNILSRDVLSGKSGSQLSVHIRKLKRNEEYNPVQYFFEHKKAPPVDNRIFTLPNDREWAPVHRCSLLPTIWQQYLKDKNKYINLKRRGFKKKQQKRSSYTDLVNSAVKDSAINSDNLETALHIDAVLSQQIEVASNKNARSRDKTKNTSSVIVNVNYIYGAPLETENCINNNTASSNLYTISANLSEVVRDNNFNIDTNPPHCNPSEPNNSIDSILIIDEVDFNRSDKQSTLKTKLNETDEIDLNRSDKRSNSKTKLDETVEIDFNQSDERSTLKTKLNETDEIDLNISDLSILKTKLNETDEIDLNKSSESATSKTKLNETDEIDLNISDLSILKTKLNETDELDLNKSSESDTSKTKLNETDEIDLNRSDEQSISKTKLNEKIINSTLQRLFKFKKPSKRRYKSNFGISHWTQNTSIKYRYKKNLQKRWDKLITSYRSQFSVQELDYNHVPIVLKYFKSFRALDVYSDLLVDLKMFCRNANNRVGATNTTNVTSGQINTNKRARSLPNSDDDNSLTVRSKRANRQEESYRNMLLPDTSEEANRKDAIYAFNFFEKVEEILKASNRYEDCKKFNQILKTFDPRREKASVLYHKMEKLFLPHHPELAQVFLSFLLPAEAAEIGKFFEHFMINNMTTFINKLNIYFNKQPAQIRKIYNCLNELADDLNVTVKKVEEKILPLLKGNQFLIDWFLQQFPRGRPPQRILPVPEYINLKEVQPNHYGQIMENFVDTFDSPTQEQSTGCQIKYINGRIFFGSKLILPAKLSFMAENYISNLQQTTIDTSLVNGCVHARQSVSPKENNADNKGYVEGLSIDSSCSGDESSSNEICDENMLRAHAIRLNSNYYSNFCFPSSSSTPNNNNNFQTHHANAKKTSLFNDGSPRKNSIVHTNNNDNLLSPQQNVASRGEKRKSPIKKATKARSNITTPMVIVNGNWKKTKLTFDTNDCDSGTNTNIVARAKTSIQNQTGRINTTNTSSNASTKRSHESKISKNEITILPHVRIKSENDSEDNESSPSPASSIQKRKRINSEDDSKLDIVASLVVNENENVNESSSSKMDEVNVVISPWTRDEDKIILTEMKIDSNNRVDLFKRIEDKLLNRTRLEIIGRYEFLMDFLTKLQGK